MRGGERERRDRRYACQASIMPTNGLYSPANNILPPPLLSRIYVRALEQGWLYTQREPSRTHPVENVRKRIRLATIRSFLAHLVFPRATLMRENGLLSSFSWAFTMLLYCYLLLF